MAKENANKKFINDVLEASLTIHNRLFNHKHFIDGEINFLINKTEKGECKDIDQLLKQLQDDQTVRLEQIKESRSLVDTEKFSDYCSKAENFLKKSNKILTFDGINEDNRKSKNDEFEKVYKSKEEEIRSINDCQLEEVDRYYEKKKIEFAKYYHELESKWDV